ncbi:MAG: DUF2029 domain-containing protein [Planctomycetes bacterium]|nr:DUF2029 domain-containing protein [Planctomycetota bacterium]
MTPNPTPDSSSDSPRVGRSIRRALPSWPTASWVILVVATAVWVSLLVKGGRKLGGDGNDFAVFHAVGERLLAGEPIFDGVYMYPPFFALLMLPLSVLPPSLAGWLWLIGKVPVLHWSAHVLAKSAGLSRAWHLAVTIGAPLWIYRFVDSDCATGNCNIYLLGGIALVVSGLERRRELRAGIALAVVAAIKLSPAYVIVALGVSRRWRVAGAAALMLAILLILPGQWLAPGEPPARRFLGLAGAAFDVGDPTRTPETWVDGGYVPGQSIRAVVHRLTRPIDATAHDQGRDVMIHLTSVDPSTAEWIYRGLALLLGSGALVVIARASRIEVRPLWITGVACTVLLVISPYARKAHFVLLLPAMIELARALAPSIGVRISLASSWVLAELSSRAIWGKAIAALFLAYGVVGAAALLLLPGLWMTRPRAAIVSPESPRRTKGTRVRP